MKSVMSLETYEKLKLKNLDSTSIPHIVGASGESLGARGKTKCEININGKNILPNIHSMRTPKKTHNSWERFLNPKLHRYFMDKNKHPQINTE